jgi:hypothetical protein
MFDDNAVIYQLGRSIAPASHLALNKVKGDTVVVACSSVDLPR